MNPKRTLHSSRIPSWAQLGRLHAPTTAQEAIRQRNLDHTLTLEPIRVGPPSYEHVVPGKRAICTGNPSIGPVPTGSIVSTGYHLTQNRELAEIIDRLITEGSVVAAGGSGASVWFCCLLGENRIGGDLTEEYLFFSDRRDGAHKFRASYLPFREVCTNGLATALPGGWSIALTHTSRLLHEADAILNATKRLVDTCDTGREQLAHLAKLSVGERLAELLKAIYPAPRQRTPLHPLDTSQAAEELWARDSERVREHRAAVVTCFDRLNDEFPANADTAWHLYNAVAEYEQHERSGRSPRSIAQSSLFGERAETLDRAFRVLSDAR